jgi:hypothetical protein
MLEIISLVGALLELLDGIQSLSIAVDSAVRFTKLLLEFN